MWLPMVSLLRVPLPSVLLPKVPLPSVLLLIVELSCNNLIVYDAVSPIVSNVDPLLPLSYDINHHDTRVAKAVSKQDHVPSLIWTRPSMSCRR